MDNDTYDDRTNIRFLKQEEFNEKGLKRLITLENKFETMEKFHNLDSDSLGDHLEWILDLKDKKEKQIKLNDQTLIRLDQEIENRTKAFERIEELETQVEALQAFNYNTDIKLERIDDILVVQRNQTDNQRKNFHELRRVLDDKVMDLLEKGEHGEKE